MGACAGLIFRLLSALCRLVRAIRPPEVEIAAKERKGRKMNGLRDQWHPHIALRFGEKDDRGAPSFCALLRSFVAIHSGF